MHRTSSAAAAAAALTAPLLLAGPAQAAAPTAPQSAATQAEECRDLANINATRAQHGLAPLKGLQADLTGYARRHAQEMAAQGRLWHDMAALKAAVPAGWTKLGENVALNSRGIDAIHTAYLASPGHRANILDPAFTTVGIGVWHDSRGVVFNSEDFGTAPASWPVLDCPAPAATAPAPTATAPAPPAVPTTPTTTATAPSAPAPTTATAPSAPTATATATAPTATAPAPSATTSAPSTTTAPAPSATASAPSTTTAPARRTSSRTRTAAPAAAPAAQDGGWAHEDWHSQRSEPQHTGWWSRLRDWLR
ncbi:CAP domain-containing protein [Quadrisphaera sp. DSM 44207]|uniref:CAP domain-containing protein n=1 Tax=Quadrisphaera sp. DSM 44207 TaxID=1881057 RepID=UPI0008806521|nr:CAP domain-containing protein [Quadrisphaera sp. DSM 44207]SDQ43311.1 Uncharacterized conserved protein YkwD, contains CAP (CSP/antigen 5/PR1) domain [Quadrisphaera sp. DSM 44207]